MLNRADRRKYHYIYKITRADGKYYIGMHSTDDLEDGYFGSGKRLWYSIRKHGQEAHSKEIIEFLPSRAELKAREKQLVNEELLQDKSCMNLKVGGEGGWSKEASSRGGKNSPSRLNGLRHKHLMESDPEHHNKTSEAISRGLRLALSDPNSRFSMAVKRSQTLATAAARKPEAIEKLKRTQAKRGHQQGEKNSNFGKRNVVVNKDGMNKRIPLDELTAFLNKGWVKGFSKK